MTIGQLYEVTLTRNTSVSKQVRVRANSVREAEDKAINGEGVEQDTDWTKDDYVGHLYLSNPGGAEVVEGNDT